MLRFVTKINVEEITQRLSSPGLVIVPHFCLCLAPGERDLQMANQRVPEELAGNGLEHRQDQGWREHVSAEGDRENAKDLSDFTGTAQCKEYDKHQHQMCENV